MRQYIMFVLTALLIFAFTNQVFYKKATELFPSAYDQNSLPKLQTSVVLAIFLALIISLASSYKENFFFEVSQPQPKCEPGFRGKNTTFEYTQVGNQSSC